MSKTKKRSRSANAVNKNEIKTRKNETSYEKRQKKVLKAKRKHEEEQERILEEIRLRKLAERALRPKVKKPISAFYPGMEGLVEEALKAAESRRAENALASKAAAEEANAIALAKANAKKLLPYAGEYPENALWGNIQWNENVKAGRDPLTGMTPEELKKYQNERAARNAANVKPVKPIKVTVERNAPKPTSVTALAKVEDTYDTLWIANLPEEINEKAIEKKIASVIEGYDFKPKGLYDMRFIVEKGIKLPRKDAKKDEKSVGYAFVKFVDHDVASQVYDAFKPEEGSNVGKLAFFHKVYQPDGKFIKVEKVALVEPSLTGEKQLAATGSFTL